MDLKHAQVATTDWGSFDLSGELRFIEDWPLSASASIDVEQPPLWSALHHREVDVRAEGNLAELAVAIQAPGLPGFTVEGTIDTLDKYGAFSLTASADWEGDLSLDSLPDLALDDPGLALHSRASLQ